MFIIQVSGMFWIFFSLLIFHFQANELAPNIIFIVVDDLGSADASFHLRLVDPEATPTIETPHLDYLANEGTKLASYYTSPLCGPSRSAILTSRLPYRLGNPFPTRQGFGDLTPYVPTIAKEFKSRNYTTHFVGKWGVDDGGQVWEVFGNRWVNKTEKEADGKGPKRRGFDTFYGLYNSAHNHYTKRIGWAIDWHRHNTTGWYDYPDVDPEPDVYSTHIFTRETISIVQSHGTTPVDQRTPFFLHLSYTAPHDPLMVPQEYEDHPMCASIPNWRRKTFCGMVRCLDEGIGNITSVLRQYKLLDSTIIAFVSDNGGFWYLGGRNYPSRGFKGGLFEGGVHVPAFVYAPKFFPRGGIFRGLFHAVDWAPTLLSMVDQARNLPFTHSLGDIEGQDLSLALFSGVPLRQSIILGSDPFSNGTAYIHGDFKLILGMAGLYQVAVEPDSYWTIDSSRVGGLDKVEESIVNFLHWLSIDLFPFGWTFHILFATYRDFFLGTTTCTIGHHPDDTSFFRNPNQTFPIVLPALEWDSATPRVFLFNLRLDPFERNNIALENRELVELMSQEVTNKLRDAPPQVGAIHYAFRMFAFLIRLAQLGFLTSCLLFGWLCSRPRKSNFKAFFILFLGVICWAVCRRKSTREPKDKDE